MPKDKLRQSISELRDQITDNESLGDDRKEELDALAGRIESMMNGDADHWEEKLVDGLEQRYLQYEEEHPVVARIIREITNTLSNIGL